MVEAIRQGKFHLWPVHTIDEGIEVLTGVKAGERQADGSFEPDTVNALVDQRLRQMADDLQRFGKEDSRKNHQAEEVQRCRLILVAG